MSEKRIALAYGFLAVLCWSGFIVVTRHGGKTAIQPHDMLLLRFAVGSLVLILSPGVGSVGATTGRVRGLASVA